MAEQGWEAVSETVLGRHLLLWDEILEQPFLQVPSGPRICLGDPAISLIVACIIDTGAVFIFVTACLLFLDVHC